MKHSKQSSKMKGLMQLNLTLYALVFAVLMGLLLAQAYLCFQKYLSFPTYIESHIVDQQKASFPDITICPAENQLSDRVLEVRQIVLKIIVLYSTLAK